MPQEPQSETPSSFEQRLQLLEQREVYFKASPLDYILLSARERSDLCAKVRTLERELNEFITTEPKKITERNEWRDKFHTVEHELDEARQEVHLINLDRNEAVNDLSKARERISTLEKECHQNNQAACLFDRDAALAELDNIKSHLEAHERRTSRDIHMDVLHLCQDKEKAEQERDLLAKQNHRMMEALEAALPELQAIETGEDDIYQIRLARILGMLDSALSHPDISSLTVLTRAEVEKLPCTGLEHPGRLDSYCPRCTLLERFTK